MLRLLGSFLSKGSSLNVVTIPSCRNQLTMSQVSPCRLLSTSPATAASFNCRQDAVTTRRGNLVAAAQGKNYVSTININHSNSRLETLKLTGSYLAGLQVLPIPQSIHLPQNGKCTKIEEPEGHLKKTFITEINKASIETPLSSRRPRMEEPITRRVKKHAIRMVVLRRKKMKKHQLKRLWDRMYLRFRAKRMWREKTKEIAFRNILTAKVSAARKFDAEKFVNEFLEDYHTPLVPGTYKGKRLPEWLIKELLEKDKQDLRDKEMEGKSYTSKEKIVKDGETVDQFIKRTWK